MNRKDTIIIAVLLNVAILAVLFLTAVNNDDENLEVITVPGSNIVNIELKPVPANPLPIVSAPPEEKFQLLLGDLDNDDEEVLMPDEEWNLLADVPSRSNAVEPIVEHPTSNYVEITVKKGDSLERIAKANGTTIQSIKDLNKLKNDRLNIGQRLQVDVGSNKKAPAPIAAPIEVPREAVYHTIKSGDSPWKIAKQFHVNMDDLLRLNNLDEEKARSLKVGDKIRVQ
jgi:LysM repeat protein